MGGSNSKNQEKDLCLRLQSAIVGGNEDVVKQLLQLRLVDPNNKLFVHSRKLTLPLVSAVENNCPSLIEVLLEYNVNISAVNREGNTALHIAVTHNLLNIAKVLLQNHADPCILNKHGETPLHIAAAYGSVNMATLLINSGASVNISGKHRRTPLHSACAITGSIDMITTLLSNNADPNCADEYHRVPLHYLSLLGKTQGMETLLLAGANKNAFDCNGKTALHFTVENQEVQATRVLIRHGCDVNVQDNSGQTPLHKAVDKEYAELVSILVQNGADPNLPTMNGYFPLRIAVWKKNFDISQKLLLNGGAQVNACDRAGITALHVACLYAVKDNEEDMELVELLLSSGADVNAQTSKHSRTPLHNAVQAKNDETIALLLRFGADPNLSDSKGRTPRSMCSDQSITVIFDNASTYLNHGNAIGVINEDPLSIPLSSEQIPLDDSISAHRSHNLYTPPSVRSNGVINFGLGVDSPPPPLPPRDVAPLSSQLAMLNSAMQFAPHGNVIRHNFIWSSMDQEKKSTATSTSNHRVKVDLASSSKLLLFPTSFGDDKAEPMMFCYSLSRAAQLVDTKLGCVVSIESDSVDSTMLLYAQALNYSNDLLSLPTSHRLCSNIIHFYTHYPGLSGNNNFQATHSVSQPEKEVPRLSKPVLIEFPLRKSALSFYNTHENEFKILVSYDEGIKWEETQCKLERIVFDDDDCDSSSTVHLVVTESDELGMYAVLLGPKKDFFSNLKLGDKVTSSVDPGINLTLNVNHGETYSVETSAESIPPTLLEKLHNQGYAYVLSCSRILSTQFANCKTSENETISVSISLPISVSYSSAHGDISYRVLKKSEELMESGWQPCRKGVWEDVTVKECLHMQVSTKGKRLLGSANSSPPHVSFVIMLDTCMRHSFLVTAVRSFTASLTKHLVQVPDQIEQINKSSYLSFLIHQKVTRLSEVTCDVVFAKDAEKVNEIYRESESYPGPPPSSPKLIYERDSINISPVGGIKLASRSNRKLRKITFHSCLLPYTEIFHIKGTTHSENSSSDYVGSFLFERCSSNIESDTSSSNCQPRSALSSESSVLVMENKAFTESSCSQSTSSLHQDNNFLASLPLQLPRKHRLKINKQPSNDVIEKSQLNRQVLELVCKRLDGKEFTELAFQLDIPKERYEQTLFENPEAVHENTLLVLEQWNSELTMSNQDPVPPLCSGLRCIGRENLSQDVARLCNPFVLEELSGLAPLPEDVLLKTRSSLLANDED